MDNTRVIELLNYIQTFDGMDYGATKIALNKAIESIEKLDKITEIMEKYEKTFDWGCNDSIHPIVAHAVYGVITGKEHFLEEFQAFEKEN